MVNFATALMIAARPDLVNPGCYVNAWDSARFVFDIISCIFFIWKLLDEVQEMIRYIKNNPYSNSYTVHKYIYTYMYIYCIILVLCIVFYIYFVYACMMAF